MLHKLSILVLKSTLQVVADEVKVGGALNLNEDDAMTYMDRLGDSLFYTGTDKKRTNIFPTTFRESV